jgi:hypothetical protein
MNVMYIYNYHYLQHLHYSLHHLHYSYYTWTIVVYVMGRPIYGYTGVNQVIWIFGYPDPDSATLIRRDRIVQRFY